MHSPRTSPPRILIVEDESVVALDIRRCLEERGYEVCAMASTGDDAAAKDAAHLPDVVLMDVHLRGSIDGIETAKRLRATRDVPVVFLSGNADPATIERALTVRPYGYVVKPFNVQALQTALEVALQNYAANRRESENRDALITEKRALELQARSHAMLNEMGDLLLVADTADEVCALVARYAPMLNLGVTGAVYLMDGDARRGLLESVATWGSDPPRAVYAGDECRALRRGRAHCSCGNGLVCAHLDADQPMICVPMLAESAIIGSLCIKLSAEAHCDGDADPETALATAVAQRAAMTIAALRLRDQLKRESIVDPLTGLYNRRHLDTMLDRDMRLARRQKSAVSLITIDVDHFKRFNDEYGHAAGDAVLRSLGAFLRANLRVSDTPCRAGGEELAIVLPATSHEDAAAVAEKLCAQLAELVVHCDGATLPSVTASFGVATCPRDAKDTAALFAAADAALYAAKRAGRNCVQAAPAASTPVTAPKLAAVT